MGLENLSENEKLFIGLPFLIIGIFLLGMFLKTKYEKEVEVSKCPICKESYEYAKLVDGLCPKCKIKTIDMNVYYNIKKNKYIQIYENLLKKINK